MPVIEVTLSEGREPETIRRLISNLTDAVVSAEVAPKENVRIIVREVPADHFAAGDVTITERAAQSKQRRSQP